MTQEKIKDHAWRLVIILAAAFASASAGITTYTIGEVKECRDNLQSMAIDVAVMKSDRFMKSDGDRLAGRIFALEYWQKAIDHRRNKENPR